MCKCTPEIKTPFCGKGDCQWPKQQEPDLEVESMEPRTYSKSFYCKNCERHFEKRFNWGDLADQPTCPLCGVHPIRLTGAIW